MIIDDIFINSNNFVVAISGGSDSLCLTMLANDFAVKNGAKMCAVFVDHMLRKESSSEILPIIDILKENNINYAILQWKHDQINGNLENKARIARYDLLYQYCLKNGYNTIVTGHHLLDNWETFFMRLSKGSGLTGLASIQNERKLKNIAIIRPLLQYSPQDIKETLLKKFNITTFVIDSMNFDTKYERVKWRNLYKNLAEYGLDMQHIGQTINRLQLAEHCLTKIAEQYFKICFNGNFIIKNIFNKLHLEIKMRIIKMIVSKDIVSYSLLKRYAILISKNNFKRFNICGYIFSNGKNIKVHKESRKNRNL